MDEQRKRGGNSTRPPDGDAAQEQTRALWAYLMGVQQTDVLMVHLAKVSLDPVELRFTHAKSELMLIRSPHTFPFPTPPYTPPSLTTSSPSSPSPLRPPPSISLPPVPHFLASSYLSPSHPLWHQLSSFPLSTLRRFFPLSSFSILSSMHRTSQLSEGVELQLELELDIDFASLARVKREEDGATMSSSFARELSISGARSSRSDHALNGAVQSQDQEGGSGMGQREVAELLCRLLQGWSSITVSNACFVFFPPPPSHSADEAAVPCWMLSQAYVDVAGPSIPFALLRLTWRTKFLSSLTIAFHACDPGTRACIVHSLQAVITSAKMRVDPAADDSSAETEQRSAATTRDAAVQEEEKEDVLRMDRAFSARSTASSQRSKSPSPGAMTGVELVHPFGVMEKALEALIIRPSYVLSSSVSSELFYTLFPQQTQSSSASAILSYSSSRQHVAVLRSYMRYHTWTWELASSVSMKSATRLLRGARAEEGFVLVASTSKGSVWLRELLMVQPAEAQPSPAEEEDRRALSVHQQLTSPISPLKPSLSRSASTPSLHDPRGALHGLPHVQSVPPSTLSASAALSHIPPSSEAPRCCGRPSSCLIQMSIIEIDATHIQTELWMEPLYGLYHFVLPSSPSSSSTPSLSYQALTSEQLFLHLSSWMHSCDLHLLSVLTTFDSVRDLELEVDIAAHMTGRGGAAADSGAQRGDSSGLQLRLSDDFHARPAFDYDHDSQQRLLSRFSPATCHPTLLLSIGTVNRVLGLLRIGSHSAMYATLTAHGGSLLDLNALERERRGSNVLLANLVLGSDDLPRLKRGTSVRSGGAREEDEEESKRSVASPLFSPPRRPVFSLTSPVSIPHRSVKPISPLASPSLSAQQTPGHTASASQRAQARWEGQARRGRRLRRKEARGARQARAPQARAGASLPQLPPRVLHAHSAHSALARSHLRAPHPTGAGRAVRRCRGRRRHAHSHRVPLRLRGPPSAGVE